MRDDIKSNSRRVYCPDFENRIVKIQSHQDAKLSAAEKKAVKAFLIEETEREERVDELSFVLSALFCDRITFLTAISYYLQIFLILG